MQQQEMAISLTFQNYKRENLRAGYPETTNVTENNQMQMKSIYGCGIEIPVCGKLFPYRYLFPNVAH